MDFTITDRVGRCAMIHDESLPPRLIEEVHDACLLVEEAMGWVLDGDEYSRVLSNDVVQDVDDVE